MDFPLESLRVLVELVKAGIASGNLLTYLLPRWAEAASAIIELLQWAFAQTEPDPVGAAIDHESHSLFGQLAACWQEEAGIRMDGPVTFSPALLIQVLMWLIELWANRQKE